MITAVRTNAVRLGFHSAVGKHSLRQIRCSSNQVVDLRSDTVTLPSKEMLETAMSARLGDDVMGEDQAVLELQDYIADLTGKEGVRENVFDDLVPMPRSDL